MEDKDEVEIRSEAVRDYLEQIPHWLFRAGIYVIAFIVLGLFVLSSFIHYPTIVRSDFRLTSKSTLKPVVAKVEGSLERLFVKDHHQVAEGTILGFIESTAKHEEVLTLEKELQKVKSLINNDSLERISMAGFPAFENLGEVQLAYQAFQQSYFQIASFYNGKFYEKKRAFLLNDIKQLEKMSQSLRGQLELHIRDAELAEKEYQMNKKLFGEKVISSLDLDREESKALAKKLPIKTTEAAIVNNNTQLQAKEREILELDKSVHEQTQSFYQSINTLQSSIALWRNRYLLVAPAAGEVYFSGVLQEKQHVKANVELLLIGKSNLDYIGEIKIPQANFGKVKTGQKVLIKFQGYPYEEYGAVEGVINTIAQIPSSDASTFFATIDLPKGLMTTSNKTLIYRNGMAASAEIITEDVTLMERFFYNVKRVVSTR